MSTTIEFDKSSIRMILLPMFDMLLHKKTTLPVDEWLAFANRTQYSIIQNPHQFIGGDIPHRSIFEPMVKEIFAEFFEEQHVIVSEINVV